ncbi:MAG: CarD family transcriptional regulator, partial [Alphaproteobacteria bacterium]
MAHTATRMPVADAAPEQPAATGAASLYDRVVNNRYLIGGAPEGADAFVIGALAKAHGAGVVHVCRDEARMTRMSEALALFQPDSQVIQFPAWDCLPFDRVSPNAETVARRIDALGRLADAGSGHSQTSGGQTSGGQTSRGGTGGGGRVVLTTVAAILQRVPQRRVFAGSTYTLAVGQTIDQAALETFLVSNGYHRSGTVHEPGEFAIRGGLIDLFPPGAENPVRVDLFGDVIESLRAFDPMTQRSAGTFEDVILQPVSEVVLNKDTISRFRSHYREAFQVTGDDDPLYAAVSAGRRAAGMEHWLPLFQERLDTLFDYCPDALLTLDHQGGDAAAARFEQIGEHFQARLETREAARAEGAIYNPLPPDRLYLTADEWQALLASRGGGEMSPFAPPDADERALDFGARRGPEFAEARIRRDGGLFDAVKSHLEAEAGAGRSIAVAAFTAGARDRLGGLIATHAHWQVRTLTDWHDVEALPERTLGLVVLPLERGFSHGRITLISEQDVLGERLAHAPRRRRRNEAFIEEVGTLDAGDLVVHIDHGVGRYEGLETLQVGGAPHDCLRLVYDGGDKLYLPVENIDVLTRYGREDGLVTLDRLGGVAWQARKSRVKERVREIAGQLIRLAAQRLLQSGPSLQPPAGLMDEFCARFPYQETEDQERAIQDTLADLVAGRPMDRLICGDVGFGKTEVALRAAFVAAMNGLQVAVVAPTTLLARQHFATFSERFAGFPVRIAQLSRMVPAADARLTRQGLADGTVDVVIGTHALLSKTVAFKALGLVIIDEEQ